MEKGPEKVPWPLGLTGLGSGREIEVLNFSVPGDEEIDWADPEGPAQPWIRSPDPAVPALQGYSRLLCLPWRAMGTSPVPSGSPWEFGVWRRGADGESPGEWCPVARSCSCLYTPAPSQPLASQGSGLQLSLLARPAPGKERFAFMKI